MKSGAPTKLELSRYIFQRMRGADRGAVIEKFMDLLNISKVHASTYYQLCKKPPKKEAA